MDFVPSHRLRSRLAPGPSQTHVAQTLPVPVFVALRRCAEQFARCAFTGFHEPETLGDRRYIWTRGEAQVDCFFVEPAKLQYIWVEIAATAPHGARVRLSVDGRVLREHVLITGRCTLMARLPEARVFHQLKLELNSDTFVPNQLEVGLGDTRELGVAVRGIVFGKRLLRYLPGSYFRKPLRKKLKSLVGLAGRRAA